MQTAVGRARRGEGPTLLECMTYRWHGHMEGETALYRSAAEVEEWKGKCPIVRFERALIEDGTLNADAARQLREEAAAAIDQALRFAREAKDPSPVEALSEVYAPEPFELLAGGFELAPSGPPKSMSVAVNEAIAEEMARDEAVVLLGEDVRLGGYFGVTVGLVERFGKARVLDTPISENAIVGAAVGAAATGLRPICEILFSDFVTTCADPLVNQAAKLRYMSGGQNQAPLVMRTPVGGFIGMAAQHSQCLEGLFAGVPGLIVCAPSDAYSAKGILKSAIRSNNPVLFFEHKLLYADASAVPEAECLLPLGKARIRRRGEHATVVGILYGASLAMAAAEQAEANGISCEVIDPVTLYPLDVETLVDSVRRTGRLLVVEEAHESFGFGARIVAAVVEAAWDALRAPPTRVAALEAPIPYSKPLELAVLPDVGKVVAALRSLVGRI
jgi:pyruvate/2-oxoglutarate/acetoin dehydrogenase E1 component